MDDTGWSQLTATLQIDDAATVRVAPSVLLSSFACAVVDDVSLDYAP